jgi:3-dehydroquinate synthase
MQTIQVPLTGNSYNIHLAEGLLSRAPRILQEMGAPSSVVVVSNPAILKLHGAALLKSLEFTGFTTAVISIPEGEIHKTLQSIENILTELVRLRASRKCWLVALGGGVIGDMTGFAAAIYLRGIAHVQIPTTLLAQIDSAIGGKTGVNLTVGKNLAGAFHQPRTVLIDPHLLSTLPRREFNSGLFEAIKYGIIRDPGLFTLIDKHHAALPENNPEILAKIIYECAAIKADVVTRDEKEGHLRMILNFGHTFGHALEAATRYSYMTHGEAVGHGMILAANLSCKLGMLREADRRKIESTVKAIAPLPSLHHLSLDVILEPMQADKKFSGARFRTVLPTAIGQVEIVEDTSKSAMQDTVAEYLDQQVSPENN